MKKITAVLLLSAYALSATGQAGSLDPTFGSSGRYVHQNTPVPYQSLLQSSEKIITFGSRDGGYFATSRHLADGGPDSTYGNNGTDYIPAANGDAEVQAGAVQPDDKIIIAGSCAAPDCHIALIRVKANGGIDSAFGINGSSKIPLPGSYNLTRVVRVLPGGKILLGGAVYYSSSQYTAFTAQLNANGTPDSTYGTNGVNILNNINALVMDIAIEQGGKAVCALDYNNVAFNHFYIMRLLPNGSFDNSFGTNGMVETFYTGISASKCVAIQSDNKIVVAGNEYFNGLGQSRIAIARYLPDGSVDAGFGTAGKVTSANTYSIDEQHIALKLQNDQKILVATGSKPSAAGNFDFLVCRFRSDGVPDSSFGGQSYVLTDFNANLDAANAIAIRNDGKIIVSGISFAEANPWNRHAIARYNICGAALTSQPASLSLQAGNTAQFTVSTPTPGATFQWQVQTSANWTYIVNGGQYSGANTPTLTIANISTANNLQHFRCLVYSDKCLVTSDPATLRVSGQLGLTDPDGNGARISIYPNPATHDLGFEVDQQLIHAPYRITDLQGRSILSGRLDGNKGHIDIHSLQRGSYLFCIPGQKAIKIVKL